MSKSMNKSPSIVEVCVWVGLLAGAAIVPGLVSIVLGAPGSPDDPVPGNPYYRVPPIYIPYPQAGKIWPIKNYGPVGIGIDLIDPAFTMRISNVEKGSPAEATGRLKKGQIIESINGETLKDIDPRVMEQMVTANGGHSQAKTTVAAKQRAAAAALQKSADKEPAVMSPAVKARLQSRIEKIEFRDVPLSDVIGFVEEFTTLKLEFDRGAMKRLGISDRVAVTVNLNNASVGEILEAVLAPHRLACVERDGRLLITARR